MPAPWMWVFSRLDWSPVDWLGSTLGYKGGKFLMRLFRAAALLPLFLLAACFGSDEYLFTSDKGRMPLPAGNYVSADSGWDVKVSDDHYQVPGGISGYVDVVLVPLPGRDRLYIVEKGEQRGVSYSLLKVLPGGRSFALLKSDCAQAADRAAADGLAKIADTTCTFDNPRSLSNAMTRLADAHLPERWVTYTLK